MSKGINLPKPILEKRLDLRRDQVQSTLQDLRLLVEQKGYNFQDYAGLIRSKRLPLETNLLGLFETVFEFEQELKGVSKDSKFKEHRDLVQQICMLFGKMPGDIKTGVLAAYLNDHRARSDYAESFSNPELPLKLRYLVFNDLESESPEKEVNLEVPYKEQTFLIYLPKPSKIEIGVVKDGNHVIVLDKETLESTIETYQDYHETELDKDQRSDLTELLGLETIDKFNNYIVKRLGLNLIKGE